jgi:hypothetical protein
MKLQNILGSVILGLLFGVVVVWFLDQPLGPVATCSAFGGSVSPDGKSCMFQGGAR